MMRRKSTEIDGDLSLFFRFSFLIRSINIIMSSSDPFDISDTTISDIDIDNYKFDASLDPTVSTFFSKNCLQDWTFANFSTYIKKDKPKALHNNMLQEYKQNMKKINKKRDK